MPLSIVTLVLSGLVHVHALGYQQNYWKCRCRCKEHSVGVKNIVSLAFDLRLSFLYCCICD